MSTIIKMKLTSKKETAINDGKKQTLLEFSVPYGNDSIWWQLSGGSALTIQTVNQQAADQFEIGKDYEVVISE